MNERDLEHGGVAELLRLAEKGVYSRTERGALLASKIRKQWCIRCADLDPWITAHRRVTRPKKK